MKHLSLPKTALAAAITLLLSGCFDSGSSSSSSGDQSNNNQPSPPDASTPVEQETQTRRPTVRMSGAVVDGYIKEATVCLDLNLNGRCDDWEPQVTTDANGVYTLVLNPQKNPDDLDAIEHPNFRSAPILVQGGIDTDTDNEFLSILSSPTPEALADYTGAPEEVENEDAELDVLDLDGTNITAVTSLLNRALERALNNVPDTNRTDVEDQVREQLGIPDDIENLNDDPILLLNDRADFLAINVSINRAIETLVSTAGAGDEDEWRQVSANVYRALAIAVQEAVEEVAEATAAGSVIAANSNESSSERLLKLIADSDNPAARRVLAGLDEKEVEGEEVDQARLNRLANAARIAATTARETDTIYRESQGDTREERLQAAARTSTNVVRMVEAAVREADLDKEDLDVETTSRVTKSAQAAAQASTENALLIGYLRLRLIEDEQVDLTVATQDGTEDSDLVEALRALAGEDSANEFDAILSLREVYPYLTEDQSELDKDQVALIEDLLTNIENTLRQDVENFLIRLGYQVPDDMNLDGLAVTDNGSITLPTNLTINSVIDLDGFPEELAESINRTQDAIGLLRDFNIPITQSDLFTLRGLDLFYDENKWDKDQPEEKRLETLKDEDKVPASIRDAIAEILQNFAVVDTLTEEGIAISSGERDAILNREFDSNEEVTFANLDVEGDLHENLPSSVQRKVQRTSRALDLLEELHILEDLDENDIKALRGDMGIYLLAENFTVQQLYSHYQSNTDERSHLSALQDLKEWNEERIQSIEDDGFLIDKLPQEEQDALIWRPLDSEDLSDYLTLFGWIQAREVIEAQLDAEDLELNDAESIAINQQISTSGGLGDGQDLLSWLEEAGEDDLSRLIKELTPEEPTPDEPITEPTEFNPTVIDAAVANYLLEDIISKSQVAEDFAGPVLQIALRSYAIKKQLFEDGETIFGDSTNLADLCDQGGSLNWSETTTSGLYSLQANNCYFTDWDENYVNYLDGALELTIPNDSDSFVELTINTPQEVTIAQEVRQDGSGNYNHTEDNRSHPVFVRNWSVNARDSADNPYHFLIGEKAELIEINSIDHGITLRLTDYELEILEHEFEEASFSYNFYRRQHHNNEEIAVRVFTWPAEDLLIEGATGQRDITTKNPYVESGRVIAQGADDTRVVLDAHSMDYAWAVLRDQPGVEADPVCSGPIERDYGRIRNADICAEPSDGEPTDPDPGHDDGGIPLSALSSNDAEAIAEQVSEANWLGMNTAPLVEFAERHFYQGQEVSDIFDEASCFVQDSIGSNDFAERYALQFNECSLTDSNAPSIDGLVTMAVLNESHLGDGEIFSVNFTTEDAPLFLNTGDFSFDLDLQGFSYTLGEYDGDIGRSFRADYFAVLIPNEGPWEYWDYLARSRSHDEATTGEPSDPLTITQLEYTVSLPDGLTFGVYAWNLSTDNDGAYILDGRLEVDGHRDPASDGDFLSWIDFQFTDGVASGVFQATDGYYDISFNTKERSDTFELALREGDFSHGDSDFEDGLQESKTVFYKFMTDEFEEMIRLGVRFNRFDSDLLETLDQAIVSRIYMTVYGDFEYASNADFCVDGGLDVTLPSEDESTYGLSFNNCTFEHWDGGDNDLQYISGFIDVEVTEEGLDEPYSMIRMLSNTSEQGITLGRERNDNLETMNLVAENLLREIGFQEFDSNHNGITLGDDGEAYAYRYTADSIWFGQNGMEVRLTDLEIQALDYELNDGTPETAASSRYTFNGNLDGYWLYFGYETLPIDIDYLNGLHALAEGNDRFITEGSFQFTGGEGSLLEVDIESSTEGKVRLTDGYGDIWCIDITHNNGYEVDGQGDWVACSPQPQ